MSKDILARIVETKTVEVEEAKRQMPEDELKKRLKRPRSRRLFLEALKRPGPEGVNIIAEIKRASPSKGDIRMDLNAARYARAYEEGGAAALSVLTDTTYFKGSLADLKQARAACALPVLRKEFIISEYQLYESVVAGADAVLLIARILPAEQLKKFVQLCRALDMDALVEIHNEDDIEKADHAEAELIGINNRNLANFETNIQTALKIGSLLKPHQVAVAASGISGRRDIEYNVSRGIRNFLIGEHLVRSNDPAAAVRQLLLT